MGAYRKSVAAASQPDVGSPTFNDMVEVKNTTVLPKGSDCPVTFCEVKHVDVHDYASKLDLPKTKDYQLEVMLRNGIVPEEVSCGHMLDSTDPLDRKSIENADFAINELSGIVNKRAANETPAAETSAAETPAAETPAAETPAKTE